MKRALILLALLCGCGSSVTLGSFASDGGSDDMICVGCDDLGAASGDFAPQSGSFDLGPSDLLPADLGFAFDLQ